MNGFINFFKPSGVSSAYAINGIKKLFKGCKIGHMGTLDPLAEGVLPIAVGKATRLFDFLLDKQKEYVAEFTFGYQTDTLDRGGNVVFEGGKIPSKEEILAVLPSLIGVVEQIPPAFSAKNVNGARSYTLARRGVEVELKAKTVEIDGIELVSYENGKGVFKISCKGGTYIRSICRDLAKSLGTFATMTSLVRTKSGACNLDTALPKDQLYNAEDLSSLITKPDSVLTFEKVTLNHFQSVELINGRPFKHGLLDGTYSIYLDNGDFVGVGIVSDGKLRIKAFILEL